MTTVNNSFINSLEKTFSREEFSEINTYFKNGGDLDAVRNRAEIKATKIFKSLNKDLESLNSLKSQSCYKNSERDIAQEIIDLNSAINEKTIILENIHNNLQFCSIAKCNYYNSPASSKTKLALLPILEKIGLYSSITKTNTYLEYILRNQINKTIKNGLIV